MENVIFDITKEKSNFKGFWLDSKGKVYIDNIKPYKLENAIAFELKLMELFEKGEKAVFVIGRNEAYIIYEDYKITLKNKIEWKENHLKTSYIKRLLKEHNGLTIEKANGQYIITIWKE